MKKLNITKETFEKSRYFTKKYGKLKYISESGKVFKTDKGKVLKFMKESHKMNEGFFGDIGEEIGDRIDGGISKVRKFFHGKPKFKEGDSVMLCMIEWSPCNVSHGGTITNAEWKEKKWYYEVDFGGDSDVDWWPEDALAIDTAPEAGQEELDRKALVEKYPEFRKRARTILGKKTCEKLGIAESTKSVKESSDDIVKMDNRFGESKKMKKLNITKEQFNRSKYFQKKYGKLEYVSESGKMFKTNKGKIIKFMKESHKMNESFNLDDYADRPEEDRPKYDIGDLVKVTWDFFYNGSCSDDEVAEFEDMVWTVEDVKEHGKEFIYTISGESPLDEDKEYTFDVEDYEIEPAKKVRKPSRRRS